MLKALEQLISLSMEQPEGLEIVQKFSAPQNLRLIIELLTECSAHNQILVLRII